MARSSSHGPAIPDPRPGSATWENRNFARAEGTHYLRHRAAMARWPILDEAWARRIEARRLATEGPPQGDITYLHGAGR